MLEGTSGDLAWSMTATPAQGPGQTHQLSLKSLLLAGVARGQLAQVGYGLHGIFINIYQENDCICSFSFALFVEGDTRAQARGVL